MSEEAKDDIFHAYRLALAQRNKLADYLHKQNLCPPEDTRFADCTGNQSDKTKCRDCWNAWAAWTALYE